MTVCSYDAIPYPSVPFVQSHPNRLATVATLFGMQPAPPAVRNCRVLELGCARGDNLLPLALELPEARFLGIDLSPRQIEDGQAAIRELGLHNVELRSMSILDFPDDIAPFDYIIAHGVYSWVPAPVRDKMLAICRRHLKPNGVAYISYNTYPGWRLRGVIRDALLFHTGHINDPQEKLQQAEAFIGFLTAAIPPELAGYAQIFKNLQQHLGEAGARPNRLFHDYLEEDNEPFYFTQFVADTARHGLQFLAEADVTEMQSESFPPPVREVLARLGDDFVRREQYLDFLKNRTFRQSLLVQQSVRIDRQIRPERLLGLQVAGDIRCQTPEADLRAADPFEFRDARGTVGSTNHPLTKAALLQLEEIWPRAIPFDELQAAARRRLVPHAIVVQPAREYARDTQLLAENLLQSFQAGMLELHIHPPRFCAEVSDRPVANPWSRRQARMDGRVTNLRHNGVELSDINRRLLGLLDGTRDRDRILDDLVNLVVAEDLVAVENGIPVREPAEVRRVLDQTLDANLRAAARAALLVG